MIFRMELETSFGILILGNFWKCYSLCLTANFKNGLFLDYLVFLGAVFCTNQL